MRTRFYAITSISCYWNFVRYCLFLFLVAPYFMQTTAYDGFDPIKSINLTASSLEIRSESSLVRVLETITTTSKHTPILKMTTNDKHVKIAFMGNSILYYNDSPRLIQQMIESTPGILSVQQDCCLRGGATLTSLWNEGNGMGKKFRSPKSLYHVEVTSDDGSVQTIEQHDIGSETIADMLKKYNDWDFVILNDYTQGPARPKTRNQTIQTIKEHILPLLQLNSSTDKKTIPIIIQTQAYRREAIKDTEDLGTFHNFSDKLREGVVEYKKAFDEVLSPEAPSRIAPVGEGYRYLYEHNKQLFNKLYSWDDFHPSLYGTWLQACIIYCTCYPTKQPPLYNPLWWEKSRYIMPPPDGDKYYQVQYPTVDEAEQLRAVACHVCGINVSPS